MQSYPLFVQALVAAPITIAAVATDNNVINQIGTYTVSCTVPVPMPAGAIIVITMSSDYVCLDTTCSNNALAGSQLDPTSFSCAKNGSTNSFIINVGSISYLNNTNVYISTRLQNPAATSTNKFKIYVYYLNESPLNKLMAFTNTINSPTLVASALVINYWDTQY